MQILSTESHSICLPRLIRWWNKSFMRIRRPQQWIYISIFVCAGLYRCGPEVLFKTCVAMKFVVVDDDDDDECLMCVCVWCDVTRTVVSKERFRAAGSRTERWARPQEPRVLPASRLGQDGEPRRSATVQTALGNNNIIFIFIRQKSSSNTNNIARFPLQRHDTTRHTTRLVVDLSPTQHTIWTCQGRQYTRNLLVTSPQVLKSRSEQTHNKSVTTSPRVSSTSLAADNPARSSRHVVLWRSNMNCLMEQCLAWNATRS